MHPHAGPSQKTRRPRSVHLNRLKVEQWQLTPNVLGARDLAILIVIEFPQTRERAERHIELAAGPLTDLTGHSKHFQHLRTDVDGGTPRVGIDAQHVAAVLPDAEQAIEAIEFVECLLEGTKRTLLVVGPGSEMDLGAHAYAGTLDYQLAGH